MPGASPCARAHGRRAAILIERGTDPARRAVGSQLGCPGDVVGIDINDATLVRADDHFDAS